jgi:hypothetical protein
MKDKCERSYANINSEGIASLVDALHRNGLRISRDNPWVIDTLRHGVHLTAAWSEATSVLVVTITNMNWYVSSDDVWKTLDPLIEAVENLSSI